MNSILNVVFFIIFTLIISSIFIITTIYNGKINLKEAILYTPEIINNMQQKTKDDFSYDDTWLMTLSSDEDRYFSYPGIESSIVFDLKDVSQTNIVVINNLDDYKIFCIREILNQDNIKFEYIKSANSPKIKLYPSNKNKAKLISKLDSYNINYSIRTI